MKTVALDVHADKCQLALLTKHSEVLLEMQVATRPEELRRVISGIPGPKRVVIEEGPMSAMIHDALKDCVEEVMSVDPARNALIARSEDSNDEKDAVRLGILRNNRAVASVFVPEEPHRTLRGLVRYDVMLMRDIVRINNSMKAVLRRWGIRAGRTGVRQKETRRKLAQELPNVNLRWQLASLGKRYDMLCLERVRCHRAISAWSKKIPEIKRLKTIPGVKNVVAPTLAAFIVDPDRFGSRSKLSSYAGLGIGQGVTSWKPVGRARASRRGNRLLKRVVFIAAESAIKGKNRLTQRYQERIAAGWHRTKAIRDIARTVLMIAAAIMRKKGVYDDGRVSVPAASNEDR
jgi:transposase